MLILVVVMKILCFRMVLEADIHQKLDDVDIYLATCEGKIEKPRDPKMCRHNARQKCAHCLPIDPYDEEYLKSKEIKHLSFHSYIRKLTEGHGRGSNLKRPLENIRCSIDLNCDAHKPYPLGVCTKCRPSVVTLNRQKFRLVDNISFENDVLINEFLNYWRKSGKQRVGYLIGKYQPFADVPLGIKATVAAIYEPPQRGDESSVEFLQDPHEQAVNKLCSFLSLKKVGWILSDLWSADASKGTVHCTRHKDSFLLSAEECITAAYLQSQHPNVTDYCTDRVFGSKFVTVVASGDESETVNFHGYQVSNQCMAMVDAKILCSTNHPELAYIREQPLDEKHYIADVQYTEKNEYGAEVRKDGRPLPVEFLMVDVPAGMPKEPEFTFSVNKRVNFNIENRDDVKQYQNPQNLTEYCNEFSMNQFLEQASNFHFLLYLLTNDLVKFDDSEVETLCKAVRTQDRGAAMDWASNTTNWQQLVALHHEAGSISNAHPDTAEHAWSCAHCTFANKEKRSDCAMCGLPATA